VGKRSAGQIQEDPGQRREVPHGQASKGEPEKKRRAAKRFSTDAGSFRTKEEEERAYGTTTKVRLEPSCIDGVTDRA